MVEVGVGIAFNLRRRRWRRTAIHHHVHVVGIVFSSLHLVVLMMIDYPELPPPNIVVVQFHNVMYKTDGEEDYNSDRGIRIICVNTKNDDGGGSITLLSGNGTLD